jgi:hypothetical protein
MHPVLPGSTHPDEKLSFKVAITKSISCKRMHTHKVVWITHQAHTMQGLQAESLRAE